jgi:RNA polymerase-binding transcription factor DksA
MFSFPKKILLALESYLLHQKRATEERLETLKKEDPFFDSDRIMDNAAEDTEAKEEIGHERIVALQKELEHDRERIEAALMRIKKGKYGFCRICGKMIDTARLEAIPTAELCVVCEKKRTSGKPDNRTS